MARKQRDRLYYREGRGWYMDLRNTGGALKACIPPGKANATHDRDEASKLLTQALDRLKESQTDADDPMLSTYAKYHLKAKAQSRRRTQSTISRDERALRIVLGFFGIDVRLSEITVGGLIEYIAHRRSQPGSRPGTTISEQTILHELHALSGLFRRAAAEGQAVSNPVGVLKDLGEKPIVERDEAVYLEIDEGARLLSAAKALDSNPHSRAIQYLYPVLSVFLLTGARASEVFGLLLDDIDFDEGLIDFRPNPWRQLKRKRHQRTVPLWPQLRETLTGYLHSHDRQSGDLLFPSRRGGMIRDLRGSLRAALALAEIEKHTTLHSLRHTYTAARLQTTDSGAPVSVYTVMRELGHATISLIEKTYGHLPDVRHRRPVVEYLETKLLELPRTA